MNVCYVGGIIGSSKEVCLMSKELARSHLISRSDGRDSVMTETMT